MKWALLRREGGATTLSLAKRRTLGQSSLPCEATNEYNPNTNYTRGCQKGGFSITN